MALVCKLLAVLPQGRSMKALGGHPTRLHNEGQMEAGAAKWCAPYLLSSALPRLGAFHQTSQAKKMRSEPNVYLS
jgi:hypothetical protein